MPWNFPCKALGRFFCKTNEDRQRRPTSRSDRLLAPEGLVTTDLVKMFGKKKAVDRLNLQARHNSITSLLGHNGAGKSTTFGLLCGLFEPTSGDARIMGMSIKTQMQSIRGILGVCPQHDVLFSCLTPLQTLRVVGWMKGVANPGNASARWLERILSLIHI